MEVWRPKQKQKWHEKSVKGEQKRNEEQMEEKSIIEDFSFGETLKVLVHVQ